jgi:hypothetical protein
MVLMVHLIKSLFGAFFRITFAALLVGAVLAGGALLVAYHFDPVWPPTLQTELAVGAIGVLGAYAGGLTVLVRVALHAAFALERGLVTGVEREINNLERETTGSRL